MPPATKNLRACPRGHTYYKSSDCPTCPVCENERKPMSGFRSKLSAPARGALENKHITSLQRLSEFKEAEILKLHGIGRTTIPKLHEAYKQKAYLLSNELASAH